MHSIHLDFKEKIEDANMLLRHLEEVSLQKQSVQKVAILKSAYMVLLYNIIESTTQSVFEKIHDDLSNYGYNEFSDKIQNLYVDFYFKNQSAKKYKQTIDDTFSTQLKFPLLDEYKKRINIFSGNLDAQELHKIMSKYGIGALTCKNKKNLVLIKNKRNKLAHGEDTFKNSCRGFTINELNLFGKSVDDSMSQLIDLVNTFLVNKKYLNNP